MIPQGAILADIGSDHGYLPIYLCESGKIKSAIATDINTGPVKNAEDNIAAHGLEKRISTRLCDGMAGLSSGEFDTVSICGMGGELIFRIINNSLVKSCRPKLIIQPMSSIEDMSYLFAREGFQILDDLWIKDGGHIYRIMCAEYTGKPYEITPLDAYVGSINLSRRDEATLLYVEKLKRQTEYKIKAKTEGGNHNIEEETVLLGMINKYLKGESHEIF